MSLDGDHRARSGVLRFYRGCSRQESLSDALLDQGRAARVLAASKPNGLLLNVEAPELTFFIADGMNITSQLVSVIANPEIHAALKKSLRDDIRISVHAQHPVEFLGDIRDHRFDLITFGELDPSAARLAAASLAPGGLLAVLPNGDVNGPDIEELERTLSDCDMLTTSMTQSVLVAARAPDHLTAKRRGGRRKRPPTRV